MRNSPSLRYPGKPQTYTAGAVAPPVRWTSLEVREFSDWHGCQDQPTCIFVW